MLVYNYNHNEDFMNDNLSIPQIMILFAELNIQDFHYECDDFKLSLNKASSPAPFTPDNNATEPIAAPVVAGAPIIEATTVPETTAAPKEADTAHVVSSPLVGTFYNSPAPNKPPFVEVGSKVKNGDTIAIVEDMKVMNPIEADCSGTVDAIITANGTVVEFGYPLVKINKAN